MKFSERTRLGMALLELEKETAKQRMLSGDPRKSLPRVDKGKALDRAGKAVGMSGTTFSRAKAVVKKADDGVPDAQEALQEMDKGGKVLPAFRKASGVPKTERQESIEKAELRRWQTLLKLEKEAAKARQAHGETAPGQTLRESFPKRSKGKALDRAATAVGMSGTTFYRAASPCVNR